MKPNQAIVSEDQLVQKLKKLMKMNLKNFCYQDAIFFADKILHLQQSRTDKFVKAVYDLGKQFQVSEYFVNSLVLYVEQGISEMCSVD